MEELKLRGYVTPEDFQGNDSEKFQKAVDTAEAEDIRKVVIEKDYTVEKTILLPAEMQIVFKKGVNVTAQNGVLFANKVKGDSEKASWSFEENWIYLNGEEGAELTGRLEFFHAGHIIIEDLKINGTIEFEFCREIRMERDTVISGEDAAIVLMRGCNNYIMQYNKIEGKKTAVLIDTKLQKGDYVIGKDTDIHELIIRANEMNGETAVTMGATEESGIFNVQLDHTKCNGNGIVIGHPGETLEAKRYFNITATDFEGAKQDIVKNNEVKHCFFGE